MALIGRLLACSLPPFEESTASLDARNGTTKKLPSLVVVLPRGDALSDIVATVTLHFKLKIRIIT